MSLPELPTPELDKMLDNQNESQAIGEFLDWLTSEGYAICELNKHNEWHHVRKGIEQLLADYFNVDLKKAEQEKRAILTYHSHQILTTT